MAFIVLEGLDGSGKSTQVEMLKAYFTSRGTLFKYLHFPRLGEGVFGELVARFLRGEFGANDVVDPYLVALIYAGDRSDAKQTVQEWIDSNSLVLIDRYMYSNIAYQCAKIEDTQEKEKLKNWIRNLEFQYFKIPAPDISIYLDVPFSFTKNNLTTTREGADRDYLGGKKDIHEQSMTFQEKVKQEYLDLVRTEKDFHVIDCSDGKGGIAKKEHIFDRIIEKIKPAIKL